MRRMVARWALAGIVASMAVSAAPPAAATGSGEAPLTLEEIFLQGRFATRSLAGLAWTADGRTLSWLDRDEATSSRRIVHLDVTAPDAEPSVLVDESELTALLGAGSFRISQYQWSPDRSFLLLTDGAQPYTFDLASRTLRRSTRQHQGQRSFKVSPDAQKLGFVRGNDLYAVDLASGIERRLTHDGSETVLNGEVDWVYDEELYPPQTWSWSPDAQRIAFYRVDQEPVPLYPYYVEASGPHPTIHWMRYPKAGDSNARVSIGIVDVATGATRWAAVDAWNDGYVARIQWIDADRLAVQKLDRAQQRLEVFAVDAATGAAESLYVEESATWVDVHDDLRFLPDGSFLWSSARDGHNHLYRVHADGRTTQLTRGAFEVSRIVGVDWARGRVFYTSNEGALAESAVYAVTLDGSARERLTPGRGVHGATFSPDGAFFVSSHSTLVQAPRVTLRRADTGAVVRVLVENPLPELASRALGSWRFTSFRAAGGVELPGLLLLPPGFDRTKRYPVLMYAYGGPGSQVVRDAWPGARGLWHQMLAQRGTIVALFDGRGTGGRGRAFRDAVYRNLGALEAEDQIAAARHLASLPFVDEGRIALWGWSYGGYLASLALAKGGDAFKAGIAIAPVSHWSFYDTIYTERYMGLPSDNQEGYLASSVLAHAPAMTATLLIAHGSADDNVHVQNSDALAAILLEHGASYEYVVYPGRTHSIAEGMFDHWHLYRKMTAFLDANL